MFWNKYPYTDFSQINLDWLFRKIAGMIRERDGSGGFLPKYKRSDEGKTLTIVNGAPAWGESSGGSGGAFVVTMAKVPIGDSPDYFDLVFDKTWNEVLEAVQEGNAVVIQLDETDGAYTYITFRPIISIAYNGEEYRVSALEGAEGGFVEILFSTEIPNGYPQTHNEGE